MCALSFFCEGYITNIRRYLNNRLVKVLLGQRRSGKSYLLRMIIHHLVEQENVPRQNILYINKDMAQLDFIGNSQQLLAILNLYRETLKPAGKVYIIL